MIREIGANVVAVATKEDFQAQKLIDDGVPYTLLLDPDDLVRKVIGSAERFSWVRLLHPMGAMAYLKSIRSSARFFDLTLNQATQHPGLIVLDAQQNITWQYIGERLGDYPPLDTVLTELRRAL